MHLTHEIILDRPRDEVWRAFGNPANLPRWQPSLVSMEPTSGTPGEVGAVTALTFREQGQEIELIEKIRVRREPEEFTATYVSKHVDNVVSNRFDDLDGRRTRWVFDVTFTFHGPLKLASMFLKGTIRKRIESDAARFKTLLESGKLEIGP